MKWWQTKPDEDKNSCEGKLVTSNKKPIETYSLYSFFLFLSSSIIRQRESPSRAHNPISHPPRFNTYLSSQSTLWSARSIPHETQCFKLSYRRWCESQEDEEDHRGRFRNRIRELGRESTLRGVEARGREDLSNVILREQDLAQDCTRRASVGADLHASLGQHRLQPAPAQIRSLGAWRLQTTPLALPVASLESESTW